MGFAINPLQPAKVFANFSFRKKLFIVSALIVLLGLLLAAGFAWAHRDITIDDNGKIYHVTVIGGNVERVLDKADIKLNKEDLVKPSLNTTLKRGMKVKITRAFPVKIIADGKTLNVMTPYTTPEKVLQSKHIKLGALDRVEPGKKETIQRGSLIKVIRVKVEEKMADEEIAFKVEKRNDNNLQKGKTKVIQQGQKGLARLKYRIVYEDGKEIKREVIDKQIITNPVNSIVAVGNVNFLVASRGETIRYNKKVRMYSTSYTATGHPTASGVWPYRGVVSVDPRVIPFGTRMYIPGYGYAVALDKGSGVKGNHVDLFFDSRSEAYSWGSRYVDVYFLL